MPLYEYTCQSCQKNFEVLVRNARDEQGLTCPECKGPHVVKKISMFGMKSSGKFVSSHGGGGCDSCSSHNCHNCGGH